MKILQAVFGLSIGWGFIFAGVLQFADRPWQQCAMLIIIGLLLFGIGLRPIFGKGTTRAILLWSFLGLGGFCIKYFVASNIVANRLIGAASLILIVYLIYRMIQYFQRRLKLRNRV